MALNVTLRVSAIRLASKSVLRSLTVADAMETERPILLLVIKGGAVLVTLVERKSRLSLMGLSINKTAQAVKDVIVKLLASLSSCVRTLTYDNGSEFAQHEVINEFLNCKSYFCHPFSSGERGTNENKNGLIRQYLPKKMSFNYISKGYIQWIIDKLNNRPRKCLKGRTPNEVFFAGNRIALAS